VSPRLHEQAAHVMIPSGDGTKHTRFSPTPAPAKYVVTCSASVAPLAPFSHAFDWH
jgi:hypothetical protein